jgi:hypothetical protein
MKKVFIILLCLCSVSLSAQVRDEIHVLYIGNSGITFQQMHRTVEEISSREAFAGAVLTAHPLCRGGATFGYHLTNLENIGKLVEREECTLAVITGSMLPVEHDALSLISALQEMGLEVYLFMQAASRTASREVQRRCDAASQEIADEAGITMIPLGSAVWDILSDIDPEYDFFADDGSHASKKSAYMGACMIVNLLTGVPAVSPPEDYDFTYKGMSSDDEVFLRETADKYTLQ